MKYGDSMAMSGVYSLIFLGVLLFCSTAYSKIVIVKGTVLIGSGITLEEAELIAFNDARQKALNSLGVFVESESRVIDGYLTKDEIRTITGAIMSGEIIETSKEVIQNTFMLNIKVKFDISASTLQTALDNYRNRSREKKTIKNLLAAINKLQEQLASQTKDSTQSVDIVTELEYSTNTLAKLLTTKQVITYELQQQDAYQQKAKSYFEKTVFPRFYNDITKLLHWETVPQLTDNNELVLKFGFGISAGAMSKSYTATGGRRTCLIPFIDSPLPESVYKSSVQQDLAKSITRRFKPYVFCLVPIAKEYDSLNLKVKSKFLYNISFRVPVYVYVNGNRSVYYVYVVFMRNDFKYEIRLTPFKSDGLFEDIEFYSIGTEGTDSVYGGGYYDAMHYWDIKLTEYKLSDIESIEIAFGRISTKNIKFTF